MNSRDLTEYPRVAAVTGASGGLGKAIMEMLKEIGVQGVGIDIAPTADVQADISTEAGNKASMEYVARTYNRLDYLILNAGSQYLESIAKFPLSQWNRLLDLMLTGPFLSIKHAWPLLSKSASGRIIFVASTSSFVAEPYKAAYVAAKHGLVGLMKVTALEGAPYHLTANAVAPSWMNTPLLESQLPSQMRLHNMNRQQVLDRILGDQPSHRFVALSEVVAIIKFLLSPDSSGITGAVVPVDLGALLS